MKHTPGPWRYLYPYIATGTGGQGTVIGKAQDTSEGPLNWQCSGPADLENIANGKLMAAAPELLQCIEHVLTASEDGGTFEDVDFNMLREAIKKATDL